MALNLTTLFTRWGKMGHVLNVLNTSRATTVPDEVQDVLDEFASASTALIATVDNLPDALTGWQSASGSLLLELQSSAQALLVQMVEDDNPQSEASPLVALEELIAQMKASSDSVDASTVGATFTAGGSNTGDGALLVSTKRGDGRQQELALPPAGS